jgi:hypothetical protein
MSFLRNFLSVAGADHLGLGVLVVGSVLIVGLLLFLRWSVEKAAKSNGQVTFRIPSLLGYTFKSLNRNRTKESVGRQADRPKQPVARKPKRSRYLAPMHRWENFGAFLRGLRMDRGLSEAFLGHCLNMETSEIWKLEDGDIQPTDDLIDDIVVVLGLTRGGGSIKCCEV